MLHYENGHAFAFAFSLAAGLLERGSTRLLLVTYCTTYGARYGSLP
jgi:hypothetical protein